MVEATVVGRRRRATVGPMLVACLTVAAAVAAGCGGGAKVSVLPPPEVSVSQPVEQPVQETLEFPGRISAVDSVEVRAQVTAPIAGRVSRAEVTVGNLVVVGASGGPLLTTIVSLDPIYVNFDADERALVRVQKTTIARDGTATPENVRAANLPVLVALADE